MQWGVQARPREDAARTHAVARTIYVSRARLRGAVYAEMERIRASAMRHNLPLGVHTALMYQAGWFLQWKEGPPAALRELAARLAADERHRDMQLVHGSFGRRLLSGPWSMGIVQCDDAPQDLAARAARVRRAALAGAPLAPPAVWRQLTTPLRHPGGGCQAGVEAFQRVLVCAAAGTGSFDLVKWLAQTHGQEVVHRRFADERHLDVGTDYVDFRDGDRVMRVIAIARRGLMVPLTRAFLPDYSHLVVQLCGHPQRDARLVQQLCTACDALGAQPVLLGVGPGAHAALAHLVADHGLAYVAVRPGAPHEAGLWAAVGPHLRQWREAANSSGWHCASPLRALS